MGVLTRLWASLRSLATNATERDANGATMARSGDDLLDHVEDAELLACHALRHRIVADPGDLATLHEARGALPHLRSDAAAREAFFAALRRLTELVPIGPTALRAMQGRVAALLPQVRDAQRLLYFAASRGIAVPTGVAGAVLSAADATRIGTLTSEQEATFLQGYHQLTKALLPVTASTLKASETRFPKPLDLLSRPGEFLRDLSEMTLGRFAHFLLFILILLAAGATIAYQSVGEAAMARFDELGRRLEQARADHHAAELASRERQNALFVLVQKKDRRDEDMLVPQRQLQESISAVQEQLRIQDALRAERGRMVDTMLDWTRQPCDAAWIRWACDASLLRFSALPDEAGIAFAARMALKRLDSVVLPMLLGLLGAYSFVLRSLSRDIQARTFEEHSSLHHVVRLALGALAGIAAGWLLKPEQVGLLSSVPAWVLAFVAGYGIELLFAFLDRMVGSISGKPPSGAG